MPVPNPWTQKMTADVKTMRAKDFAALESAFTSWMRNEPAKGPLPFTTGWHDIGPEQAEQILRRNTGKNRKVVWAVVKYYLNQMLAEDWIQTGQSIQFDTNGVLVDAQHRMWAVYLSGKTVRMFIVADVPAHPKLFAYIDNNRPRSPAAALQTDGSNGVSPLIAQVLKIGEQVRRNLLTATAAQQIERISPAGYTRLIEHYPHVRQACRLAASDWKVAAQALGGSDRRPLVAYLGMRILDMYDPSIADDFFDALVTTAGTLASSNLSDKDREKISSDPVEELFRVMFKNSKSATPMKKHTFLACMIKCFNVWVREEPMPKRWEPRVNEAFPLVEPPEENLEAAE